MRFDLKRTMVWVALSVIAIFVGMNRSSCAQPPAKKVSSQTITISGAWAIYPTVVLWAEEFQKQHPEIKIDISAGGAGKGVADTISGAADIGMVSREPDPKEIEQGITPIYISNDAVYPIISDKNLFLNDLLKKGLTQKVLKQVYVTGEIKSWAEVLQDPSKSKPIHVYTRSDSSGAAASWAAYLGKKQEDLLGIGIFGDPGLIEATKRDPVGIGYSNFSYLFSRDGKILPGIILVPIDANANGIIEKDEYYENRAQAAAAIQSKHYPASRKNYFFVKGKPNPAVEQFLEFVLSDEGSRIVDEAGTSLPLEKTERMKIVENIKKLE